MRGDARFCGGFTIKVQLGIWSICAYWSHSSFGVWVVWVSRSLGSADEEDGEN